MSNWIRLRALSAFISEALRAGDAIGHLTVWGDIPARFESGDETRGFFFVTIARETAEKAHRALEAAEVLCDTDLGDPRAATSLSDWHVTVGSDGTAGYPAPYQVVIVTLDEEFSAEHPCVRAAYWDGERWQMEGGPRDRRLVTAWMPLPKPYERLEE